MSQPWGVSRGGSPARKSYILKKRERHIRDVAVHGGFKIGGHRRRVRRWTAWQSFRWLSCAADALVELERQSKTHALSEVACFYDGKRITAEQLRTRIDEQRRIDDDATEAAAIERATPEPDGSCKSCATRRRAGFDGECPSCANERFRLERDLRESRRP